MKSFLKYLESSKNKDTIYNAGDTIMQFRKNIDNTISSIEKKLETLNTSLAILIEKVEKNKKYTQIRKDHERYIHCEPRKKIPNNYDGYILLRNNNIKNITGFIEENQELDKDFVDYLFLQDMKGELIRMLTELQKTKNRYSSHFPFYLKK